jgi:hypothetical protein
MTATVTGNSPMGTVAFKDGTRALFSRSLVSGKATYTTRTLTKGTHSLTASHVGSRMNNASTSSAVSLTVQ